MSGGIIQRGNKMSSWEDWFGHLYFCSTYNDINLVDINDGYLPFLPMVSETDLHYLYLFLLLHVSYE